MGLAGILWEELVFWPARRNYPPWRSPMESLNIIQSPAAARALMAEFIGWQCRIRQLAARQAGGRPSAAMRPRAVTPEGHEIAPAITVLILEADSRESTSLFSHQYLKTQDPNERYDKVLEILQASYFQQPALFGDVMTGLFGPRSEVAARLMTHGRCILEFEEYAQGYRIPCAVAALDEEDALYQATYWHNRMFNPNQPEGLRILSFTPDWSHATGYRPAADNEQGGAQ